MTISCGLSKARSARLQRSVAIAACVLTMFCGCATFDPLEDTRIEAEVKARLVAEKGANLTRVGVDSTKGKVSLSGAVATEEQRSRAEALARQVRGVTR